MELNLTEMAKVAEGLVTKVGFFTIMYVLFSQKED